MKIYLIRHCESEDDILNCYGGCADFDLTENGKRIAESKANTLIDLNIKKIYSSPYKRAKEVANIFSKKINCDVEVVDDLREMNTYGIMSGVKKELTKRIFSFYLEKEEYKSFGYYKGKCFEGGESVETFDFTVKKSFEYIVNQNIDIVGIITHGGVFRSVYKNILNKEEKILEIEDAAIIEIDYKDGRYNVNELTGIELE